MYGSGASEQRLLLAAILIPIFLAVAIIGAFKIPIKSKGITTVRSPMRVLHAWLGAGLSLIMYVICFSGAVAVFEPEIHIWESPASRIKLDGDFIKVDDYARAITKHGQEQGDVNYVFVIRPRPDKPYFDIAAQVAGKNARKIGTFESRHPHTGEILTLDGDGLSSWLRTVHTDLAYRKKKGRIIRGRTVLGILGVIILGLIIAGIMNHSRLLHSLTTWRINTPPLMRWRETHNALGAWVMVYAVIITATGASIALVKPLIPVVSVLSQNGEIKSARDLVTGEVKPAGVSAEMMNIDDLFSRAADALNSNMPLAVRIINWQDTNARAIFIRAPAKEITSAAQIELSAVTGEVIRINISEIGGYAGRIDSLMTSLHYAQYGGRGIGNIALRSAYAVLGLALAFVSVSGFYYWILKQIQKSNSQKKIRALNRLIRITVGVCLGMGIATIAIFISYKIWPGMSIAQVYFLVWVLCIIWALMRQRPMRELFIILCVLCAAAGLIDGVLMLLGNAPYHLAAVGLDVVLFFIASFLIIILIRHKGRQRKRLGVG